MEKEHLKKCPFCGFQGYIKTVPNIDEDKEELFMTFCPNSDCPVQPSVEGETVDEVYKAWNTRTRPDPAEVVELVDKLITAAMMWSVTTQTSRRIAMDKARADLLKAIGGE